MLKHTINTFFGNVRNKKERRIPHQKAIQNQNITNIVVDQFNNWCLLYEKTQQIGFKVIKSMFMCHVKRRGNH